MGAATMVPAHDRLPDLLPTDRVTSSGRLRPELRAALRRIPTAANIAHVAGAWLQSGGVIALAAYLDHPLAWIAAFLLMGRAFARFSILTHEAAHRLLFPHPWWNDVVGKWLLAYPAFVPFDLYRRGHLAHHKDELGPDEPDRNLYEGYPITRASLRRKLLRDAIGISGWKNLRPLLTALVSKRNRPVALRILAVQALLLVGFSLAGRPELYALVWFAPWLTVWRVLNRLRAIAEHGGMERSNDRRRTTHHVRQRPLARFWLVPYNTGWHLAHHVDIGVPFAHLPALHRELEASGWIPAELVYPSYVALWRALSSR
jgi:fatty acid desaturase